jgi:hypothetical protein
MGRDSDMRLKDRIAIVTGAGSDISATSATAISRGRPWMESCRDTAGSTY